MAIEKLWLAAVGLVFLFGITGAVFAGPNDPETPSTLKGGKVITADEAKALIDKKSASIFDMRTALNYGKGHIPSAASVPYRGTSENKPDFDASKDQTNLSKFPADKDAKIIIYSDGPKGWKSYKIAVIAIKSGYKNIMWLRSGFAAWEKDNYPVER